MCVLEASKKSEEALPNKKRLLSVLVVSSV